ncbi:MAG: sigma-70 family RNA polymerase sigma factor [Myxococcota bacterium]|nr:sigma-70 family RNA polymerase sigma factor [Myxococcota bacterium]
MTSASDAELIAQSLPDPEAFGGLFDRHAPALLGYLVRRVGRATAEGLLGEVFRIAFEARDRFDPSRRSALPWLYGIASNLLLKHHRTEGRRLRATARLAHEPAPETGLEERASARSILLQVAVAIEDLPGEERSVLLLHAWEGLPYPAIAEALEIPVGTVRSRLHRARGRLRERIERVGKEETESAACPTGDAHDR